MAPSNLKLLNGRSIPIVGLGTWLSKPGEVTQAVKDAIDAGYRHFDCAYMYGNEVEVGEAIRFKIEEGVVKREDIFITSKLWNTFHRPDLVVPTFIKSLNSLGLEYLDLYLIHWPMGFKEDGDLIPKNVAGDILLSDVDYLDTWKELEKCVDKGLVRSLGLSNFNSQQVDRVIDNSRFKPQVLQVECYPYLNQSDLLQFCKSRGIVMTAYCPLGNRSNVHLKPGTPNVLEDPIVVQVAEKHGKTPAHVVLRYQVQRGVVVIPKSVTKTRIQSNINLFDFELSPDDMARIDSLDCGLRVCHRDHAKNHPYYPFNIEF